MSAHCGQSLVKPNNRGCRFRISSGLSRRCRCRFYRQWLGGCIRLRIRFSPRYQPGLFGFTGWLRRLRLRRTGEDRSLNRRCRRRRFWCRWRRFHVAGLSNGQRCGGLNFCVFSFGAVLDDWGGMYPGFWPGALGRGLCVLGVFEFCLMRGLGGR